jgi:hypothetical protein
MKNGKFCSQWSTYFKRHVTFRLLRAAAETKSHKKICKTLSWMRGALDFIF